MDTARRSRKRASRPASKRGGSEQVQPRLRVVREDGAHEASSGPDERLSAAVADLRWKLHDPEALRSRRDLVARGAAPLIAMPRGYEHIAHLLNSKRRLDERIADLICGVAKPLLGLVGAAGVAVLLASSPLLNERLVQAVELPGPARAVVPALATVPEQEARWLGPPVLIVSPPVVASGVGRMGPAVTHLVRPMDPFSGRAHGTLWGARVLGTPGSGAPDAPVDPAAPPATADPAAGTRGAGATTPNPDRSAGPTEEPSQPSGTSTAGASDPSVPASSAPATSPTGTAAPGTAPAPNGGSAAPSTSTPGPASTSGPAAPSANDPSATPTTATEPAPTTGASTTPPPAGTTGAAPTTTTTTAPVPITAAPPQ
jgi:hypothetical protein